MNKINVVGKVNIDNNVTNERVVTTVLMNQVHVCIYYILEDNRTLGYKTKCSKAFMKQDIT